MTETRQEPEVIVHKAIDLRAGETLGTFTRELSMGAREHAMKKLNIATGSPTKVADGGAYVTEIFSKNVVVSVWKNGDGADRYYAFSFERDPKTNVFKYGDLMEVERVTSYRAKAPMSSVTKSVSVGDTAFDAKEQPVSKAKAGKEPPPSNLPDAAFACIVPVGKKMMRHLPHHTSVAKSANEQSSVDVPRLRNALVNLAGTEISDVAKAKAREHLEVHAKAVINSRGGDSVLIRKAASGGLSLIEALDALIGVHAVAKAADGSMWARVGDDFWGSN